MVFSFHELLLTCLLLHYGSLEVTSQSLGREKGDCPLWGKRIHNECVCREELAGYKSVKCDNENTSALSN